MTRCDRCGQVDDHPKHVVQVPVVVTPYSTSYHPDDKDQDGWLRYHFDCEHEWQGMVTPEVVVAAKSGMHGDELRAFILTDKRPSPPSRRR